MLKVDEQWLRRAEGVYPGIREIIDHYEALALPRCPACGSADTAAVSAGIVGRSVHVSAATTKIRLLPDIRPEDCYCNACGRRPRPPRPTASAGGGDHERARSAGARDGRPAPPVCGPTPTGPESGYAPC